MSGVRVTHVGGPTAIIEIDGWRLLTDPTFDPPGGRYAFGWGTGSRKTAGPSVAPDDLPPIDAVLLSHDHHADNLDAAGRALLPRAGRVITTVSGERRLRGNARGLAPWATYHLAAPGRPSLEITATPCRHGPPLSRPIVGDVVGFAVRRATSPVTDVWVSGDTVLYAGLHEVAERLTVDVALVHLGGVRFPITGPLRYTMTAADAVTLCRLVRPRVMVPIHYEGWGHFQEARGAIDGAFADAADVRERVRWIVPGHAAALGEPPPGPARCDV